MSSTLPHDSQKPDSDECPLDTVTDFELIDDEETAARDHSTSAASAHWTILIIDDDEDVHEATSFCLRGQHILGKPLQLLHAHSAHEGFKLISTTPDVAVALIDVVMESEYAGLGLVQRIRQHGFHATRLILRTGQPGYAPELEVLRNYDINDYRTKTELTDVRLICALTTALRAYDQLTTISEIRSGLELVVHGVADLFSQSSLAIFSRGILTQVAALLHIPAHGVVCVDQASATGVSAERAMEHMLVISESGCFAGTNGARLRDLPFEGVKRAFRELHRSKRELLMTDQLALLFQSSQGSQLFAYIEVNHPIRDKDLSLLKVFAANISITFDNIQLIGRLDELAYLDPALKIPNTNALERALSKLTSGSDHAHSLATVRIEDFDFVVSVYGDDLANEYLSGIYEHVRRHAAGVRFIARTGDATLAFLFRPPQCTPEELHRTISHAVALNRLSLSVNATMAVVDVPATADVRQVLGDARAGLIYAQKYARGGISFHQEAMRQEVQERAFLQSALVRTLRTSPEFTIALQPKVDISAGRFVGVEALARWTLNGQPISPAKFVPIIESSGLSRVLRDMVVQHAATWYRSHLSTGLPPLPIAINLSICDIHSQDFASSLLRCIEKHNLGPHAIQFEITESGMMESFDTASRELKLLKEAGYTIAIDDFGTGYSSLSYLEKLPIDILKIDRCFIRNLGTTTASRSIAGTTIALAKSLNLEIVAEGIETPEQHHALRNLGCQVCQGFLYAAPIAAARFSAHYATWSLADVLSRNAA